MRATQAAALLLAYLANKNHVYALRQINPVSALLPFTPNPSHRVNLTLRAYDGCYHWRVQRPNAILIRDLTKDEVDDLGDPLISAPKNAQFMPQASLSSNECRSAITVTNALPPDWKGITDRSWVFAEDRDAGVKAEVYVARISRLVIETTAKAVAVGSAETVRVKAYDESGNVFSSLEGLDFQWLAASERADSVAVSLASLNEDVYRPSSVRRAMAEDGRHSDIILIKGLESGRTELQVRLTETGYDHIPVATVWIDVVEPFAALPAELAAPANAELWTSVKLLRDGVTPEDIRHFKWQENPLLKRHTATGSLTLPANSAGQTFRLMVSDARNANNSDWTNISVEYVKKLTPYHTQLTKVLNENCEVWTDNLDRKLTDLTERQFRPYSVPPTQPGSILRLVNQGLDPYNTWLLERSPEIQVLTVDVMGHLSSLHVPPNAQIDVEVIPDIEQASLESITAKKREDLRILRCSSNGATCAFQVTGEVGGTGRLVVKLSGDMTPLKRTLRYKIVSPLQVVGLAPQRFGQGIDRPLRASTTPVTLPVDAQAKLNIMGGQGPFKVTSSHPQICSATSLDRSLVISAGKIYGAALMSIRSELYPANSFDFYCVTAPVASVYLDTSGELTRIPIDLERSDTRVPVLARAKMPVTAPMWASSDPNKRSPQELKVLPHQYTIENFYSCNNIEIAVAHDLRIPPKSALLDLRAAPTPILKTVDSVNTPHICAFGLLQNPKLPVAVNAEVQILDNGTGKKLLEPATSRIEFYTPLGARVREADNLPDAIASSALVSSDAVDKSLSIIIGGSLVVELTGGPELGRDCAREVTAQANSKLLIHRVSRLRDALPNGVFADGAPVAYRIHCLEESPAIHVNFELVQRCANLPPLKINTVLNVGCAWPASIHILPRQANVTLLPVTHSSTEERWVSDVALSENQALVAQPKPFKSIHAGCSQSHDLGGVAYDTYGRPLLGTKVWHWAWRWYANAAGVAQVRTKSEDLVTIDLPENCDGLRGALSAALIWTGDYSTGQQYLEPLSKSVRDKLKTTAKAISNQISKRGWYKDKAIISSIIIDAQPSIVLQPNDKLEGALLHSTDWVYAIRARGASVNAEVKLNSSSPMSIVGVYPAPASLSLLRKTVNVKKIVSLFAESSTTSGTAVAYPRSSSDLYIYTHPIGSQEGSTLLTVEDKSLLGTHSAQLSLTTMHLDHCQLLLRDTRTQKLVREPGSPRTELEKDVMYDVIAQGSGEKSEAFADAVNNAFELHLVATPNRLLNIHPQNKVKGVMIGSGMLEGVLEGPVGGVAKPISISIDEPFTIEPSKIVLLPGGVSWRPKISGGGSIAKNWALVTTTPKYVEVLGDSKVLRTQNLLTKSTMVRVIRQSDLSLGEEAPPLSQTVEGIEVVIARPEKVTVSTDGQNWSDRLSRTEHRGVRFPVSVDLFTGNNYRFTPAGLLHSLTELEESTDRRDYRCNFIWTALKPDIASIVAQTDSRRYTRLVSTLQNAISVEIFPLQLGEAKIQVRVDCGTVRGRNGPNVSKFSGSATLTLQIIDGYTEGLTIGDYLTLDGRDESFALAAGSAPGSSCSRKPSDELVMMPNAHYDLPAHARLICEINNSEAHFARLITERAEVCDSDSTVVQLMHAEREIASTGQASASKNAVLLTPLTSDPLHRTHRTQTVLLAAPASASIELNGESVGAVSYVVPVFSRLSANEASTYVDAPLTVRLLTNMGREIQRPRDMQLRWLSSDDRIASVVKESDGRWLLRVNRSQPAHATVSIRPFEDTLETTIRVVVSHHDAAAGGDVSQTSSARRHAGANDRSSSQASSALDVHWMERYVPSIVMNSAQGISLLACAIAPLLCLFGMIPLRRNRAAGGAQAAASSKSVRPVARQPSHAAAAADGPRRAKNVDKFFNYGHGSSTFSK